MKNKIYKQVWHWTLWRWRTRSCKRNWCFCRKTKHWFKSTWRVKI